MTLESSKRCLWLSQEASWQTQKGQWLTGKAFWRHGIPVTDKGGLWWSQEDIFKPT